MKLQKKNIKALILAALLLLSLWGLAACGNSDEMQNLPTADPLVFPTVTPLPTPTIDPSATAPPGGWQDWGDAFTDGQTPSPGAATVMPQPTATSTPLPTPTPTPIPAPTATPKPASSALRNGDRGDSVRSVQQRLKELGYLSGSADGVFGNATESAVKAFQKAHGLSADGVVGSKTLEKLNSSDAKKAVKDTSSATNKPRAITYTPSELKNYRFLQLGSTGSDVRKLQNRLVELGYLDSANGTYDEVTESAVRAFQERNGQWVDGVAGEDTQTALFSSGALESSSRD